MRFTWMYLGSPPWDTGMTPPELQSFLEEHSPGRALDLGCGTGTNLVRLAQAGWQVTGVDFVSKAVKRAQEKLHRLGLEGEVICGDVLDLRPLHPPYDLVLDIGCYHGLDQASREVYRRNLFFLLARTGTFLLYAHLKSEPDARIGISEEDIQRLKEYFSLLHRQDSFDRFGRAATWMTWSLPPEGKP
ncbi:thiopurine S-methyltransferase [Anaerolinea thermolimosa]|nr:thiopurine S-methyltransferase [Anaerolinea thermolimosa]